MIVGIDPGRRGGLVALNNQGHTLVILPLIDAGIEWLTGNCCCEGFCPIHVFVEKAQVMARGDGGPKAGAVSSFNYGVGFGEILGILRANKIPHTLVPPATWTRVMHAGTKDGETKARSLEAARRLFPGETWMLGKQTKPQDGLFEAALIAEYGRRQLMGGAA